MKRSLVMVALLLSICFFALWLRGGWLAKDYRLISRVPFDVIIDGMPWCVHHVTVAASTITLEGAERGVCTSKNVRSTQ